MRSVHAPENLLAQAYALAGRLARGRSAVAVALTRQMLYRNSALPHPREAHLVESLAVLETSRVDGREGVQAFLDKRPADFRTTVPRDLPPFTAAWT